MEDFTRIHNGIMNGAEGFENVPKTRKGIAEHMKLSYGAYVARYNSYRDKGVELVEVGRSSKNNEDEVARVNKMFGVPAQSSNLEDEGEGEKKNKHPAAESNEALAS